VHVKRGIFISYVVGNKTKKGEGSRYIIGSWCQIIKKQKIILVLLRNNDSIKPGGILSLRLTDD
jgi:hypothetical protein